ncbi:hypothetical protein KAH37_07960 [bacterium]|nr:hypothetical protein [bacterium]
MKRIFFLLLLLFFAAKLSADAPVPQELRSSFKNLVDEAKVEPNDTFLISSLALFSTDMHKAHIPNCLSCSLYLLGAFKKDSLDRQLIASRYAIIISPDLPDGYFARFYNYFLYSPLSLSKHFSNLHVAFTVFSRSPASLSVYEYFTKALLNISLLILGIFSVILLIKHHKQSFHTVQHITGFSLFYLTMVVILFSVVLYHMIQSNGIILFLLMPLVALEMIVVSRKEWILLLILFFMATTLFISHSLLKQYHANKYDQKIAQGLINLYDPLFEKERGALDGDEPHELYLKGMHFFYKGSIAQSLYYLKQALKLKQHKSVTISIHNTIGILEFQQQHIDQAIDATRKAWNASHDAGIGLNLVRLLFEADQAQEAAHLEQQIVTRTTFLFPKIYLPSSKAMLVLLSAKKGHSQFFYHKPIMFGFSIILIMLVLFFLKKSFVTNITITRCQECGSLICSECSHGSRDIDVCAACQTIKQHRALISTADLKKHVHKQEIFAKKRTILELIAMMMVPGSGLILRDNVIEGLLYLSASILFISFGINFDNTIMLFSSTFSDSASLIIFFGIALAFFLLSLIRTIRALME